MTRLTVIDGGRSQPRPPHADALHALRAAERALSRGLLAATALWISEAEAMLEPASSCACGQHGAGHGVATDDEPRLEVVA